MNREKEREREAERNVILSRHTSQADGKEKYGKRQEK